MIFFYIFSDVCSVLLSSEKCHHLVDRNKYRDPGSDNMQRMRDLGTLRTKWGASSQTLPLELRELCKREGRMNVIDRGHEEYQNKALYISMINEYMN